MKQQSNIQTEPIDSSDLEIDRMDSIVAINILRAVYKIDVLLWTTEELQKMVKLIQVAIDNPELKEKAV